MSINIDRKLFHNAIIRKDKAKDIFTNMTMPKSNNLQTIMINIPDIFYEQLYRYYFSLKIMEQFRLHYETYQFLLFLQKPEWYDIDQLYVMTILYYLWNSCQLALNPHIDVKIFLNKKIFFVYHPDGEKIYLTHLRTSNINLFEARRSDGKKLLCFWKRNNKNSLVIEKEYQIVQRLVNAGMSCYYFSTSYYFWNEPVVITDHLRSLQPEDDPYHIAADILDQLFFIHKFGVSNEIKPHNIMCREYRDSTIRYRYYLFRFQHMTTIKLGNGYHRKHWSRMFSSQIPRENPQMTLPYHDLLELAYVVNYLLLSDNCQEKDNYRETVDHKVKRYLEHLFTLPNKLSLQDYQDLKLILISQS